MLQKRFTQLMARYTDNEPFVFNCWKEIEKQYTSPKRYYHTLKHLENMMRSTDEVATQISQIDAVWFAVFYHDIVYKATSATNEAASALWFKKQISKTTFASIDTVVHFIEMTKTHERSSNNDLNYLLDADLAILGQSSKIYDTYAKAIRKEYSVYPTFMYNKGRKKVLEHLLKLPELFKTEMFRHKYEFQAKENLARELSQLNN